ncbi:bacteriohemerythrin [Allofranklinella schreckenbergeri]|uniref:Bacteriohemerythrin n=1 Tax=Allofranklinella schreckenbergeri TaxID=1076744 RepID=A0A3M6QAB3_9BURK|nr:bacteriohemerythrin [Allofranklinella schreckenbergeri]RMW99358.1 bacteriohemerythrin [Allofranklinella schreckenbergeri]
MSTLEWTPDMDTGIAEIDGQHRRIVEYINMLHEVRQTPDRQRLGEVIAEMVDYTISHFAFEEALIEEAGYVFSGPHKKVHELFTRRVAEMQSRFDSGEDVSEELHGMLSRWLFNHIRNEDHGYVEAVLAYQRKALIKQGLAPAPQPEPAVAPAAVEAPQKGWLARMLGL